MKERDTSRLDKDRLAEKMIKELQRHNIPTYSFEIESNYIWNKGEIKCAGLDKLNKKEQLSGLLEIERAIHKDDPEYKYRKKSYLEYLFKNKQDASYKQKEYINYLIASQEDRGVEYYYKIKDENNITSFCAAVVIPLLTNKFKPLKANSNFKVKRNPILKEINTRLKNARANNTMLIKMFVDSEILSELNTVNELYKNIQRKIK